MTALLAALILVRPAPLWSVNPNHTLVWGDKPYMPVGVRLKGEPPLIKQALASGVRDFIVDLPSDGTGWAEAVGELEAAKARYVVAIATESPRAKVFDVEPDAYRVPNIEGPFHLTFDMPGADKALVVLAQQTSATERWRKTIPVVNGKLKIDDDQGPGSPCVLLIYPYLKVSEVTDFWEQFDGHRDTLLATLGRFKAGPGFRGILNPLGTVKAFIPKAPEYVPLSAMFRVELEAFLRKNYPNPTVAAQAWSLGFNDLGDFHDFARLVPLWNGKRGMPLVYDPDNDRTYTCETQKSRMWSDLRQVMSASAKRRYANLVDAVQQAVGVPVIEEWRGWGGPYEDDVPTAGVGASLHVDRLGQLVEAACRPTSTLLRSLSRFGWATGVTLGSSADSANAQEVFDMLTSMGMRGCFFRCSTDKEFKALADLSSQVDPDAAQWKPNALFYPEAANDPAAPGRLGGNLWWLPAPIPGERLDLGSGLEGYTFTDSKGQAMAVWSVSGTTKAAFKVQDPGKLVFEATDGSQVVKNLRKQVLEIQVPPSPLIIRGFDVMPTPVDDYGEALVEVRAAIDKLPLIADIEGDGLYKIKNIVDGFDRSPDLSYRLLKEMQAKMAVRTSPYNWIEADKTPDLLFASRGDLAGASDGHVLVIADKLGVDGRATVNFPFLPRVNGTNEVWMSARVAPQDRDAVIVRCGSQTWTLNQPPKSFYGMGLAWFKLGDVDLNGQSMVSVQTTRPNVEVAIDVIMVSPKPFRPRGPRPPLDFLRTFLAPVKGGGKGSGGL